MALLCALVFLGPRLTVALCERLTVSWQREKRWWHRMMFLHASAQKWKLMCITVNSPYISLAKANHMARLTLVRWEV